MSKITAASIRPIISGVGYHQGRVPKAEEFTAIDASIATYGTDACGNDAISGNWSVQQDPNHSSFNPSLTGNFNVSGAGAVVGTGPAGSLVCTGSVPTYSAPRTRRVRISMLEAIRSYPHVSAGVLTDGNAPVVDPQSGGITTSTTVATNTVGGHARIIVPLTKPHDGAQFSSCVLYWYVPAQPAFRPSLLGSFRLESVDLTAGTVTTIGSAGIGVGSSAFAWWANGQVQSVTIGGLSTTISLTTTAYRLVVVEPACAAGISGQDPYPVWLGIEVNYQNILDEGFPQ